MEVTVGTEGAVTVVKPLGPIIAGELEELTGKFSQLNRNWTKRLVVDMSEVTYIDSAGLELILSSRREMSERGLKLKLSGLNDMTRKIFDLTGLTNRFEIYPDTTVAVGSYL
jgi:anti-anti-sigma factor